MASDGSSHVQNTVTETQTAALGFRVKSGWAAVVLLTGTPRSPQLSDVRCVELCDPRHPETRQPYHAGTGELETDLTTLNRRERVVRSISEQTLTKLVTDYRQKGFRIGRAALVVGSKIDPDDIANPHIRAHALEGRLFRLVVEQSLHAHSIRTEVLLERDAYSSVAALLKQSGDDLKRTIQNLRRWTSVKGPWRAEQKLAALAALLALG